MAGWFSSLFGAQTESFFGIQLLIKAFGEDTIRAKLDNIINHTNENLEDIEAKRRYLKRIVAVLMEHEPYWSQVYWDYKSGSESQGEFDKWVADISASTATEHEEIGSDVDKMYRTSRKKDYVAITLLFHLNERYLPAEIDDEAVWWRHQTIKDLINNVLFINPENIAADGVFVIPSSSDDGLSEEDLLSGGWEYLNVIT